MISFTNKNDLPPPSFTAVMGPDRPLQSRDLRKFLFFLIHEGLYQSIAKVMARLDKQRSKDSRIISARFDKFNAISFDAGLHFYISDQPTDYWVNPFSYDQLQFNFNPGIYRYLKPLKHALYCVGYGNYIQTYTQYLRKKLPCRMFIDYNPEITNTYGKNFEITGYDFAHLASVWANDNEPVAIIASYHSDHAIQAQILYKSNPEGFIFVEKPPLVDYHNIQSYRELYRASAKIQIGFNRRYAPLVNDLKSMIANKQPMIINISVNEIRINDTHWYHWPNQGTRITGNACHWIDLCQYFTQDKPIKIQLARSNLSKDDCALLISYKNGSFAVITLTDKGNDLRGVQETIEIKQANFTFRLDDMLRLTVDSPQAGRIIKRSIIRDKGHKRMYEQFAKDIAKGEISEQYPLTDLEIVSRVTFEFSEMLKHNISEQSIDWYSKV
jgi:predicted dehydrogenase